MRRSLTQDATFLAVGLVLGVVLRGFFSFSKAPRLDPVTPPDSPAIVDGAPARSSRPSATSRDEVDAGTDDGLLAAILAAVPAGALDARGEGSVTGRVVTEGGRPLEGVRLRATANRRIPPRASSADAPAEDLLEAVRAAVEGHRWREATLREARTDSRGYFRLEGLADTRYRIEPDAEGYRFRAARGSALAIEPGARDLEFIGERILSVTLDLRLPQGVRPPRAAVRYVRTGDGFRHTRTWTPAAPTLELAPGEFVFTAECAIAGQEFRSSEVAVALAAADAAPTVVIPLGGRPGIRGRVLFPPGEAAAVVQVLVRPVDPGGRADAWTMLEPGPSMVVNAGFDTEYGFADLEPGTYLIGYARGGGDPDEDLVHTSEVIEVTDRIVSHDIRVEPLDRARCLVLWIYGPDGQLVGDATRAMRVGHVHPVNGRFRAATTVRQSDGSFWLLRPPETDAAARRVANGRRILRVGSPEYGEHEVEYAERTTAELTVRFSDPAVLEVVVEGYNPERSGEGIFRVMPHRLDASGMARERRDSRWFPSQTELGASGRTSFRPLEPGEYEVTLSFRAEGQNGDLVLSRTPVTLRPGANETVVNMPPLYTLVVVADAARWARVLLHPRDGANGSTLKKPLGENRSVSFTDLPSGEYRVELKELRLGPDGEAVEHRETGTVHVSGDTEYRF